MAKTNDLSRTKMTKNADLTVTPQAINLRRRKYIERGLMLLVMIGLLSVASLYGDLFTRLENYFSPKDKVYGVWVEQYVAPYSAKRIELSKAGVISGGRVLTTSFEFDGRIVEYQIGDTLYRYKMRDDSNTEMTQMSSSHYNPTFRLSGKYQKNLR
ncbi:N-acetylglutamate synthase [Vibrio qinghaiensis]|uniref:N-acetylglutamate synthase n=2 Tax=Vibrio qinghaiensis TaxID=2025808 RepID=A0A223MZW0_9VIBR|nr:N-acetylglutamate synthase [Vibrio qinghaiensis]